MGWPFLTDMCNVVSDVLRLQYGFNESIQTRCICKGDAIDNAESMFQAHRACYGHKVDSLQVINALRIQDGEAPIEVDQDGFCPSFSLQPCFRIVDASNQDDGSDAFSTKLVPHSCPSCFENVAHLPVGMLSFDTAVYHKQTLEQYMAQMLHAVGACFPCVHCRPHFANIFRNLYCDPFSPMEPGLEKALRIQSCLSRITMLNEPKPMPLTPLRPYGDGVHFLWLAHNLVNARTKYQLHEEYWRSQFTTHYQTNQSTPEHAWKFFIVIAIALYTKYDKLDAAFVEYREDKLVTAGLSTAMKHAEMFTSSQREAHRRFLDEFVCEKPNMTEFHASYKYGIYSKDEAMADYLKQCFNSLCIERNKYDIESSASVAAYESANANRSALPHLLEACSVLQAHSPAYRSMAKFIWPIPPELLSLANDSTYADNAASAANANEVPVFMVQSNGRRVAVDQDSFTASPEDGLAKWLIFRELQWYEEHRDVEVLLRGLMTDQTTNVVEITLPKSEATWLYESYDACVVKGNSAKYNEWLGRYLNARLEHYRTLLI